MTTFEEFGIRNKPLIDELAQAGVPLNAIWLQAGCRCEYCGFDLLSDYGYRSADSDHILPKSVYPQLIDRLSNYALACKTCHILKGRYDPGRDEPRFKFATDLTPDERRMLIDRVKSFLGPEWKRHREEIATVARILKKSGARESSENVTSCASRSPSAS